MSTALIDDLPFVLMSAAGKGERTCRRCKKSSKGSDRLRVHLAGRGEKGKNEGDPKLSSRE